MRAISKTLLGAGMAVLASVQAQAETIYCIPQASVFCGADPSGGHRTPSTAMKGLKFIIDTTAKMMSCDNVLACDGTHPINITRSFGGVGVLLDTSGGWPITISVSPLEPYGFMATKHSGSSDATKVVVDVFSGLCTEGP